MLTTVMMTIENLAEEIMVTHPRKSAFL